MQAGRRIVMGCWLWVDPFSPSYVVLTVGGSFSLSYGVLAVSGFFPQLWSAGCGWVLFLELWGAGCKWVSVMGYWLWWVLCFSHCWLSTSI